jgi:tripartite-type tricarboxylate transporter receptor subunit TctC
MFDATKFKWLGSPTSETNICAVNKDSPWQKPEDYFTKDLLVGTDGVGSGMHIYPVALNQILGTKFRVIDGYADSGVVLVAADRGELNGSCQSAETLMRARGPQIRSGEMKVVLQAGLKPDPHFKGVPFVMDLAKTDDQKQALRFLFSSLGFGRPFVMPPGTPDDKVAVLQKAFTDTFADPDFLRDAKKQGYDIEPTSGPDMAKLVDEIAATPPDIVERVRKLVEPEGSR